MTILGRVDDFGVRCVIANSCGSLASGVATLSVRVGGYANCDDDGGLSIDDFICFQTFFAIGDPFADCDGDGSLSIDDFICFQTLFAIGC